MRIGIVGGGLIGARRANVAAQSGEDQVVAVADTDTKRASDLAASLNCGWTASWGEIVAREDIDIVVVSTPNKFLMPVVVAALQAGKHALCEKPMGRNAQEAAKMAAAAQLAGRVLKVGFNHRYHPAIWKAHELCVAGEIGTPWFIRAVYGHGGRPGYDKEWRGNVDLAGGGELLDQGVHIVDLCRWFLGDFSQVSGITSTNYWELGFYPEPDPKQMEDNAFAILKTASGRIAQLHTSWTQWKNRFSFEVFGRDGFLRIEGLGGSYGKETLTLARRRPESGPPLETIEEFEGPDASWRLEWEDFTRAIRTGQQPLANGEDGVKTMQTIAAIYAADRTGAAVTIL
jgi:predicted dehydrogenase